jgi:Restriction endonuclease
MPVTRTLNPLPFSDLEPKRFEDLVRQLVYDFRPWIRLEATGRAGSDDGYDARGIEGLDRAATDENENDDEPADEPPRVPERAWLIQCKRERTIGPSKLEKYLEGIAVSEREKLYGLIFVASCDFSKKSRDVLADRCRSNGLSEFQIGASVISKRC